MKKTAVKGTLLFITLLTSIVAAGASLSVPRAIHPEEIIGQAGGENSLPGVILRDGTVCALPTAASQQCQPLFKIPPKVTKAFGAGVAFFDGIFDLDRSGAPQVFIDYWPDSSDAACPGQYKSKSADVRGCDAIAFLVYKKSGDTYGEYVELHAPTMGYNPGAWFLDESPLRKAIFETRYGGSSGNGLFYLNWKKRALDLINDDFDMMDPPAFEDLDGNRNAEILVTARGYDRTAKQGAALFRWQDDAYRLWWPTFTAPYVIYAQLVPVVGDNHKELVGVLDPASEPLGGSTKRELAVWRVVGGGWRLVDKKNVSGVADPNLMVGFPVISKITSDSAREEIVLTYRDGSTVACEYRSGKIACGDIKRRAPSIQAH